MPVKTYLSTAAGLLAMIVLIFDSSCTSKAAYEGLILCIRTIIPTLFPFFVISSYLNGRAAQMRVPGMAVIEKFCHIPDGSGILIFNGAVTGYPVGARSVYEVYHAKSLSENDARRMLGFCNNAGPAFIFGIGAILFDEWAVPWILWMNQIISALLTGWVIPGSPAKSFSQQERSPVSLAECVKKSIATMGMVCGWILIFKILIDFLNRWIFFCLPDIVRIILSGLLELSNGCILLAGIPSPTTRYLICNMLITAGGLCVWMQTKSTVGNLDTSWYIKGKIVQIMFSFVLAISTQKILFPDEETVFLKEIAAILLVILISLRAIQKRYSNSLQTHV